jgi:hypothetical protein
VEIRIFGPCATLPARRRGTLAVFQRP